jgi:hypothetical protein
MGVQAYGTDGFSNMEGVVLVQVTYSTAIIKSEEACPYMRDKATSFLG